MCKTEIAKTVTESSKRFLENLFAVKAIINVSNFEKEN